MLKYLSVIVLLSISFCIKANVQYSFLRIDNMDGLVNNHVTCFLKDTRGFIWVGTSAGLSRYDGSEFVNFKHSTTDTSSIIDNYIENIQEDEIGNLWIKTRLGYVYFDVQKESFTTDIDGVFKIHGLKEQIDRIYIDEDKNLWIKRGSIGYYELYNNDEHGLMAPIKVNENYKHNIVKFIQRGTEYYYLFDNGLINVYSAKNYLLKYSDHFLHNKMGPDSLTTELYVDNENDMWFYGNYDGVYYYNFKESQWKHFNTNSNFIKLSNNIVTQLIQDDFGKIWIGTDHGGLNIVNKYSGEVVALYNQADNEKSIAQNSITALYVDDKGIVWGGTYKKGVFFYHENVHKFLHFKHIISDPKSLPYNDVNCFTEDNKGNLWIGTNGGGLIYFNRNNNTYRVYKKKPGNVNSLSSNVIVSLFWDKYNILWIGTYTGGLVSFDGSIFKRYLHDKVNEFSLPNNNVWSIIQDGDDLLLGMIGGGVARFNRHDEKFTALENRGNISLVSKTVNQILRLKSGNLAIATDGGVSFYDAKENRYKNRMVKNTETSRPLINKSVKSVCEDSRGLLWFATHEGLAVYNPNSDYLKHFSSKDGFPEDFCNCILEDEFQAVWVSKSSGLSQVVVKQNSPGSEFSFDIYDYSTEDGLQSKEFNTQAAYKTSKKELIFGGPNGFNIFQARNIKYNRELPKVVFTDFQIYNQSVKPDSKTKNSILQKSITYTDKIVLKHSMNVFSIRFSALDFLIPQKIKFKYQLEGFNDTWLPLQDNMNSVTYTNLNAGDYIFKVKAANNDGLWNENYTSLHITVLPPFYATPWAFALYVFIILLILVYLRYSMLRKERLRFVIEQERLQAKRNHEMDEMKLRFLTNVSHEFRTPLTLILTPLDRLLKKETSVSNKKLLETIDRNAKHLLGLVNQLLDFRKLELHGLRYNPSYGDIVHFLHELNNHFKDEFKKKGITYLFEKNSDHLMFNFDREKLQKVMMNLLSNALKFTQEGGTVILILDIKEQDGLVELAVKDTGVGIEESELENIFVRFYQSKNNKKLGLSGSGIGLNLAKEMIQLHNGTIRVESVKGKGSTFIVSLPLDQTLNNDEGTLIDESDEKTEPLEEKKTKQQKEKSTILLVEDNVDFRTFMRDALQDSFIIHEAQDGKVGLDAAYKQSPDLIISDVMMPNIDGLELCRTLRADIRTSHIPIILLTARTADEDKIKGLEIGADDYITKPFNMDLLLLRIDKLIEKRNEFQKKFQKTVEINPSDIQITSLDEKLIKKAVALVEKNISESKFSVEDLSRELGMSRVYLYKKLLSITGKSPVEFIRIIRLKRGAQLLEKSQKNVAEIAYEVGFNSPRYFSKYFKEEYGMLPTAYIKKQQKVQKGFQD